LNSRPPSAISRSETHETEAAPASSRAQLDIPSSLIPRKIGEPLCPVNGRAAPAFVPASSGISGLNFGMIARQGAGRYGPAAATGEDMTMREKLANALKDALKAQDKRRISTVRLIQAAIKDRDIANRGAGKDMVGDEEILQILGKMVKQREDSARMFEEGGRIELAAQEREEIAVIRSFLPQQLGEEQVRQACAKVIEDVGADGLRDMGRCMNALKERYPGKMDFAKASGVVKGLLGSAG
jgi:uncharacterized protein